MMRRANSGSLEIQPIGPRPVPPPLPGKHMIVGSTLSLHCRYLYHMLYWIITIRVSDTYKLRTYHSHTLSPQSYFLSSWSFLCSSSSLLLLIPPLSIVSLAIISLLLIPTLFSLALHRLHHFSSTSFLLSSPLLFIIRRCTRRSPLQRANRLLPVSLGIESHLDHTRYPHNNTPLSTPPIDTPVNTSY